MTLKYKSIYFDKIRVKYKFVLIVKHKSVHIDIFQNVKPKYNEMGNEYDY